MPRSKREARLEAEAALAATTATTVDDASSEEIEEAPAAVKPSAFDALQALDEPEPSDDEDEVAAAPSAPSKSKKRRKKKKSGAAAAAIEPDAPTPSAPSTPAAAKGKAKTKPAPPADDGLDEIDKALREIAAKNGEATVDTPSGGATDASPFAAAVGSSAIRSLLAVDAKNLDADAELRRLFGARVVNSSAHKPQARGAVASNPHHSAANRLRTSLAKPEPHWPPVAYVKSGLTMEQERSSGAPTHTFVHSRDYKSAQRQFLDAVASHDGDAIYALLQVYPYHLDSLLQCSSMSAQQGDLGQADDFVSRALYAMERAFSPTFSLVNGTALLDFRKIESRVMFRAIERRTSSLIKRGCWRTAFEHARLLLQLDPVADPYGALLFLDFLAPKAKQATWLDSLMRDLPAILGVGDDALDLQSYPGLAFAHALATFDAEGESSDHGPSTRLLTAAVLRFPMLVLPLFDKLQLSWPAPLAALDRAKLSTSWESSPGFLLHILSHLYVHRSHDLWRPPPTMAWLQRTVTASLPALADASNADVQYGESLVSSSRPLYGGSDSLPAGVIRHILAADIPSMRAFMPPVVLSQASFAHDLLPPPAGPGVTYYDRAYFAELGAGGQPASGGGRGGPGRDIGRQLVEAMRRAGLIGADEQPTPEELAQILYEQDALAGNGVVPGAFGGEDDEDDEDDEWDDDDEAGADGAQAEAGAPRRWDLNALLGGLLNR